MAEGKVTTAWIWLANDQVQGLSIDLEQGRMEWQDVIGCHCTDENGLRQTIDDYRQKGPPPTIGDVPDDVAAEIATAVAAWRTQR